MFSGNSPFGMMPSQLALLGATAPDQLAAIMAQSGIRPGQILENGAPIADMALSGAPGAEGIGGMASAAGTATGTPGVGNVLNAALAGLKGMQAPPAPPIVPAPANPAPRAPQAFNPDPRMMQTIMAMIGGGPAAAATAQPTLASLMRGN